MLFSHLSQIKNTQRRALLLCTASHCFLSLLSDALAPCVGYEKIPFVNKQQSEDREKKIISLLAIHNHILLFHNQKAVRPQSYCFFCQIFVYTIAAFIIIAHSNRFFSKSHESLCDFKILPSYCQLLAAQPPLQ